MTAVNVLRIFISQEVVGGGRVFIQPPCLQLPGILLSQTAAPPLTKDASSPLLLSCSKLFISAARSLKTSQPLCKALFRLVVTE